MYHLEQKERHTVHSSKKNIPKTQNPNKVKFGCVGTTFQQKAFCVGGWCGTVRVVCRLPSPFERMGFPPCDSVELPRELGLDTKAFHTPKKKNAKSPHTQRLKTPYENHSVSGQGWFGSAHTRTPTSGLVWVFQTEVRVILFNSMGFCFVVVMFRSFLCQCLREKKRHFVWTIS
mmetsp:Transcript_13893/g.17037  ORF Transcript_13893/g.17037 Transcript_13893/m.17037 type:complete len:174 (-) Transcript_13893:328-849(-)